jgi:phosphoribosylformylglycinamidine synthase subunit PurS
MNKKRPFEKPILPGIRSRQFGLWRNQADQYWAMKVNVIVKPKEAVLDPQGNAVRDAMRHLGMPEVRNVRIGKYMEIDVDGEGADVEKRLHGLCRDLLSNPVIEDYELRKTEVGDRRSEVGNGTKTSGVKSRKWASRSQTAKARTRRTKNRRKE